MKNTYWNNDGKFQELANQLQALVPDEGECATDKPMLEKFRQAVNCYHDFYNNGLCNRAAEFRKVFGFSGMVDRKVAFTPEMEARVEERMNHFVLLAASENLCG